MNLNYFIGSTYSKLLNHFLKYNIFNIQKHLPFGLHHKNDLKKILGSKDLIIFDVGANLGNTVLDYHLFFSTTKIFCFEPVLKTFDILSKRVEKYKNISVYNTALGDKEEQIEIFLSADCETNSLLNVSVDETKESEKIKVERLDIFCAIHKIKYIDLLKIDVEGFEIPVLDGCGDMMFESIKAIYVDVGFVQDDALKTNFKTLDSYLINKGFILCGFYEPFRWGLHKKLLGFANALYIRNH